MSLARRKTPSRRGKRPQRRRAGFLVVLTAVLLPVICAFAAFAVDTTKMTLARTYLQNAVDAASLAASQEITGAIYAAAQGEGDATIDANSIAVAAARAVAHDVAEANGVYIDPATDVTFGKRSYHAGTDSWPITWGAEPYNVVRVTARRDQDDLEAPDGRLPLSFGWAVGVPSVAMQASSTAFVEARDIVVVLDFSSSMNDDSTFDAFDDLTRSDVEANMAQIYENLGVDAGTLPAMPEYARMKGVPPANGSLPQIYVTFKKTSIYVESSKDISNVVLEYSGGARQKFEGLRGKTGTFYGTGSYAGKQITKCWVKSGTNSSDDGPGYGERFEDTVANVKKAFGLDSIPYPYPYDSWDTLINYCRYNSAVRNAGYEWQYGGICWMNYLLNDREQYSTCPDLWKTPHYPFQAVKAGCSLFCDFLTELDFGDEVGLASYATTAHKEMLLDTDDAYVDLTQNPITSEYDQIDIIQVHKQAGHYDSTTNMGDGIKAGRELLEDHMRYGARPTMLVMTDGQANVSPGGWALPCGWNWADLTDYDGDGVANYTTYDRAKQYAFYQAKLAIDRGYTIHTMSVGADGDRNLLKAIAFAGGGVFIDIPGGSRVADMEEDLLEAFRQIAGKVPPPKLVYNED